MRNLATTILTLLLLLSVMQAQDKSESQQTSPRLIDIDRAKQFIEMLKSIPETHIGFENFDGAPLRINDARVKIAKFQHSSDLTPVATQDEYMMDERIELINNTDNQIKLVTLQFTDGKDQEHIKLSARTSIDPYGSYVFGDRKKSEFDYRSLPVNPGEFTVRIWAVKFEDGTIWERYPSKEDGCSVDQKPKPMSKPQPKYTEAARQNRIQGVVLMRLLVSTEGKVKKVKILSGLPDGLDEEAIEEAYNLKFQPAMKDGQAVECWLLFEVDFVLRQKTN